MATIRLKPILTISRLREVIDYDPSTGIFRWRVSLSTNTTVGSPAGGLDAYGYLTICIDYQPYKGHRLAWFYVHGEWPAGELDHEDLVKHHNWITNLREANQTQNNANRRTYRNNKCGFKGVYFWAGRYRAMIRKDRKGIHIGCYDTPEEAHQAYCAKAKELFGDFANVG